MRYFPNFLKRKPSEDPIVPVKFIFWENRRSNRCNYQDYRTLVEQLQEEGKINPEYSLDYVKCSVDDIVRCDPIAVLLSLNHKDQVETAKRLFKKKQCDIYIQLYLEDEGKPVNPSQICGLERIGDVAGVLLTPSTSKLTINYNKHRLENMFRER